MAGTGQKILVVEDEPDISKLVSYNLAQERFKVLTAEDGEQALKVIQREKPNLVVLDLMLPGLSGMEVCKILRERPETAKLPILMLTAKAGEADRIVGLEMGADDYLVKPFQFEELLARTKALLRRAAGQAQPIVSCGPIVLDTAAQQVRVGKQALELTAYEYKLLEYLMLHAGDVVSKTTLTEHIYDQDFDRDSNVIEVFIGRLRKKLDPDERLNPIETLRGRGYRFTLPCGGP